MTRFRYLAAATLGAVALLAACGDSPSPAATVNGTEISQDELVAELKAIDANTDYVSAQESAGQAVRGADDGSFDTDFVSQILRLRVLYSVVGSEVDARGLEISEACLASAQQAAEQGVGGADVFGQFDQDYQDELVQRQADLAVLSAELSGYPCDVASDDALLQTYFDEHTDQFTEQRCVSVIEVPDQAAADAVLARLAAGEEFATVATEASVEQTSAASGGSIGCFGPGELTTELDGPLSALEAGGVTAPIDFNGSLLIGRVDEIQPPSLDSQRDAVVAAIGDEVDAAFGAWAQQAFADADVVVDPRYGAWDSGTLQIQRADGGTTTTTSTGPTSTTLQPEG